MSCLKRTRIREIMERVPDKELVEALRDLVIGAEMLADWLIFDTAAKKYSSLSSYSLLILAFWKHVLGPRLFWNPFILPESLLFPVFFSQVGSLWFERFFQT